MAVATALLIPSASAQPAIAQQAPATAPAPAPFYADIADLVLRSPIVLDSVIRSAVKLRGEQALGAPPGMVRLYVEADLVALVRGTDAVPGRLGWIIDVAPDARGKLPNWRKQRVLVFARPVAGRANQVQLTGPTAQLRWSAAADMLTRRIIAETIATDAPPRITGIGNAFHVAGALPGSGETQIFLQTEGRRPVSLNVIRAPGEEPRWAVALTEIVDEAAAPPAPDTLLWYRLACGLPDALPAAAITALSPQERRAAAQDYRFILNALGPCRRG
ncbi:hypothetical protein [Sphingomonas sp.]|uniref:hypothetical protein n=1 Tax=Sphingomonas sp. TaxID=28214 RepID=UPI0035A9964D